MTSGVAAHLAATWIGYRPVLSALFSEVGYALASSAMTRSGAWNRAAKWMIISGVMA